MHLLGITTCTEPTRRKTRGLQKKNESKPQNKQVPSTNHLLLPLIAQTEEVLAASDEGVQLHAPLTLTLVYNGEYEEDPIPKQTE